MQRDSEGKTILGGRWRPTGRRPSGPMTGPAVDLWTHDWTGGRSLDSRLDRRSISGLTTGPAVELRTHHPQAGNLPDPPPDRRSTPGPTTHSQPTFRTHHRTSGRTLDPPQKPGQRGRGSPLAPARSEALSC